MCCREDSGKPCPDENFFDSLGQQRLGFALELCIVGHFMTQMEAASPESLADDKSVSHAPTPAPTAVPVPRTPTVHSGRVQRLYDKVEAFVSKLSMRDN